MACIRIALTIAPALATRWVVGTSSVRCPIANLSQSSDEVPAPRSSFRNRLSSSRIPSVATTSSSSKTSSSRASSSKAVPRQKTTSSPFISSGHWTRKRLQAQWDHATREAGSASVTIINEVDGEEVPGVPEDFQYLEHGYDWGRHAPDRNFLIGCDCVGNCSGVNTENCCIRHIYGGDLRGFWYDKRVRFPSKRDFSTTSLTLDNRVCSASAIPTFFSQNAT